MAPLSAKLRPPFCRVLSFSAIFAAASIVWPPSAQARMAKIIIDQQCRLTDSRYTSGSLGAHSASSILRTRITHQ